MTSTRRRRRLAIGAGALATVLALAAAFVAWRLPSDDELAARIVTEFNERTGVELKIAHVHWTLWPSPAVAVQDVATVQDAPILVRHATARMPWSAVFARELRLSHVEIEGVAMPREAVRAFRGKGGAGISEATGAWKLADVPVAQVLFTDVTWVDRRGIALRYDGVIDFDAHWRPRTAELTRRGVEPLTQLRIEREGDSDRWKAGVDVAGGTWSGVAALTTAPDGRLSLDAQLEPRDVDIELLMQAFGRGTPVAGKLNGRTTLDARGETVSELWHSLHTRTRFTVKPATLTRFDLAKAVRSAGTSRAGRTPLDELTGTLDTQVTDEGMQLRYRDLKARSGVLTATGSARVVNRKLDGEVAVDIVDGVVGMPLKLGGTLDAPELSLTGAALAGAAVGTAVLPGVGTAIGARIGQQIERIFGDDDVKPAPHKGPRAP